MALTITDLKRGIVQRDARISALEKALRELEDANEVLCAGRSQEAYDAMLRSGQTDALLRLDEARRAARNELTR